MPHALLKNPELAGIRAYLAKKERTYGMWKYGLIGVICLHLMVILFFGHAFGMIEDILQLALWTLMLFMFHYLQRECAISDEEILTLIEQHRLERAGR